MEFVQDEFREHRLSVRDIQVCHDSTINNLRFKQGVLLSDTHIVEGVNAHADKFLHTIVVCLDLNDTIDG